MVAVPSVKWALGIAGIMAALALGSAFFSSPTQAAVGVIVMLALMSLLVLFAASTTLRGALAIPALVLTWSILVLFVICALMTVTSVFFSFPLDYPALVQQLAGSSPQQITVKVVDKDGVQVNHAILAVSQANRGGNGPVIQEIMTDSAPAKITLPYGWYVMQAFLNGIQSRITVHVVGSTTEITLQLPVADGGFDGGRQHPIQRHSVHGNLPDNKPVNGPNRPSRPPIETVRADASCTDVPAIAKEINRLYTHVNNLQVNGDAAFSDKPGADGDPWSRADVWKSRLYAREGILCRQIVSFDEVEGAKSNSYEAASLWLFHSGRWTLASIKFRPGK
jgi:hypothetical protein